MAADLTCAIWGAEPFYPGARAQFDAPERSIYMLVAEQQTPMTLPHPIAQTSRK
jgi:hypothetical protein